jgi:ribosomal-protein-alanine N-acetyltransferase
VTNIAILEPYRGRGYGKQLTRALLQYFSNLGAAVTTLEVRESNVRARHVYESLGFFRVGRRKKYYTDNGEDALLMLCDHLPEVEPDFEEPETQYEE